MSEQARTAPSDGAGTGQLEAVIGLEIHVQLATATKMFCGCPLSFGDPPNVHTCAVCLGLPGSLPVANARAVHFGLMIGLALGSELAPRSLFHRKNYFYPDLPKGYQISQYSEPLCSGGELGGIRIHRVHLEEDAAKLIHVGASGRIHGSEQSLVDFNRGGTPLAEIVTEPDIHSAEQAGEFLKLLRSTLRALGVSDVNMEQGSLRADANISLRPAGSSELGVKTELKNMNSFRFTAALGSLAAISDMVTAGVCRLVRSRQFIQITGTSITICSSIPRVPNTGWTKTLAASGRPQWALTFSTIPFPPTPTTIVCIFATAASG